jgi:hypothetical protein
LEEKEEDASGIEMEKLDKLILVLKDKYNHFKGYDREDFRFPWVFFETKICPTPTYFEKIIDHGYYKFANTEERSIIDNYVKRRIGELNSTVPNVFTYLLYTWNSQEKRAMTAVLQLNREKKVAFYSEYVKIKEDTWVADKILCTSIAADAFRVGTKSLQLNLVSEDPSNPLATALCFFAVNSSEFYSLDYIKGTMTLSTDSSKPASSVIVLKKQLSFEDTLEIIMTGKGVEPELCYAVLDHKIEVSEENLTSIEKFSSYATSRVIQEIVGAYWYTFILVTAATQSRGNIGIGTCYIQEDGVVLFDIQSQGTLKCYVDDAYITNNHVHISHFFDDGKEPILYDYKLEILRDFIPGENNVIGLRGHYSSIFRNGVYSGHMIFTKNRDWSTFDIAKKELPAATINPNITIPKRFEKFIHPHYDSIIEFEKRQHEVFAKKELTFSNT